MKLLVTGGAGFIGSAVVRLAVSRGHQVVNVDVLTYAACLDNVASVAGQPGLRLRRGRHPRPCGDGPDSVPNTPPTRSCTLPPKAMWTAPSTGRERSSTRMSRAPTRCLEAARAYWTRAGRPGGFRFHHISTDEVYGTLGDTGPLHRGHALRAQQPLFGVQGGLRPPRARLGRDLWASGRPDELFQQLRALPLPREADPRRDPEPRWPAKPIPVYGRGENVRDWLYRGGPRRRAPAGRREGRALGAATISAGNNERRNIDLVRTICALLDEAASRRGHPMTG